MTVSRIPRKRQDKRQQMVACRWAAFQAPNQTIALSAARSDLQAGNDARGWRAECQAHAAGSGADMSLLAGGDGSGEGPST